MRISSEDILHEQKLVVILPEKCWQVAGAFKYIIGVMNVCTLKLNAQNVCGLNRYNIKSQPNHDQC